MKSGVVVLLCLMGAVLPASAGYTDDLLNESAPRIYYDCGDWSGVHNAKDTAFGGNFYWYRKRCNNGRYMRDLTNWGYPSCARSSRVFSEDVAWAAIHIMGFDKELHHDGVVYTDNPKNMNYMTSYLRYRGWWTLYFRTYNVESVVHSIEMPNQVKIINTATFYSRYKDKDGDMHYRDTTSEPYSIKRCTKWPSPSIDIVGSLTDYKNYVILYLPTPCHATGVKITTTSNNSTAEYERHAYCLELNKTAEGFNICNLIAYDYHNFTGIVPYGVDSYLLPPEPDYNVTMTLYTPFEVKNANVTLLSGRASRGEPTQLKTEPLWRLLYLLIPISLSWYLVRQW